MDKKYLFVLTLSLIQFACSTVNSEDVSRTQNERSGAPVVEAVKEDSQQRKPGAGAITISKLELNGVVIHSITAPEDSELVNSHIIETKNSLVIVDMQFLRPYAMQLKAYADKIGKPIDRVILTHQHPDHWFGFESFEGIPIYAHQEVIDGLKKAADFYIKARRKTLGELVPETKRLPEHVLASSESIDGLHYEFEVIKNAEAGFQTITKLPDYNVLIAGDLLSSNAHSFYGVPTAQSWVDNLKVIADGNSYDHILVGHGKPPAVNQDIFAWQISYIETALTALKEPGPKKTFAVMKSAYPELGAEGLGEMTAQFYHGVVKPRMAKQKQQENP